MNIEQKIQLAKKYYESNQIQKAIETGKEILSLNPDNLVVLLLLAEIAYKSHDYSSSEKYLREAITYYPERAELYSNLGLILQHLSRADEAVECFYKAIELNPNLVEAYYSLGIALHTKGKLDEAKKAYQKAIELNPRLMNVYYNLGLIHKKLKEFKEAAHCFKCAIQGNLESSEAYSNLGIVLAEDGQNDEAIVFFQKAILINQKDLDALLGLATVFQRKKIFNDSIKYYNKALLVDPQNSDIYFNLGLMYREKWELDKATECFQKAANLDPNNPEIYYRMGGVQFLQGRLNLAAQNLKKAIDLKDDFIDAYQTLIMLMNYTDTFEPREIFTSHVHFAEKFEARFKSNPFNNSKNRLRKHRLRIGYFSPDFRNHSVAYFIEPVLMSHSRKNFEVFCYSNVDKPDYVTKRIQLLVKHWRDIKDLSDDEAMELIQKDKIDILVDLAGHTYGNRVLLFARKPAPIQISWIGYPSTTGLSSMDYKIVDYYTDPPSLTEGFYTEKLIRLPQCFLCYKPEAESPDVALPPFIKKAYITFGSFNNFAKVSQSVVKAWANILGHVPCSRLVLKSHCFSDIGTRQYAKELFKQYGIMEEKIEILPYQSSVASHLSLYGEIDIALDTFPYNGTTTTCEALWMGVPVITLAGKCHAGRVGVSLLTNVGLREFIAESEEEYVKIAVRLAEDIQRLKDLRLSLRDMMKQSPLMDAKGFTLSLERCFEEIWQAW